MIRRSQLNKMVMIAPFFAPFCPVFEDWLKHSRVIYRWKRIAVLITNFDVLNTFDPFLPRFSPFLTIAPFLKIGSNIVVPYTVGSVLQCLLQILMF